MFVHPALKLNFSQQFDGYDTARSVGREFSLVMATIRLINSGVFDRHPSLTVHMAHLGGGIAGVLGARARLPGQGFLGRQGQRRHGRKAEKDFDHYINNNMLFDTAGFCCAIGAVKPALVEIPASRIVFATDYPQEMRERQPVRDFVNDIRAARQGRRADPVGQRRQADQGEVAPRVFLPSGEMNVAPLCLIDLGADLLDQGAPLVDVVVDQLGELGRRVGDTLEAFFWKNSLDCC